MVVAAIPAQFSLHTYSWHGGIGAGMGVTRGWNSAAARVRLWMATTRLGSGSSARCVGMAHRRGGRHAPRWRFQGHRAVPRLHPRPRRNGGVDDATVGKPVVEDERALQRLLGRRLQGHRRAQRIAGRLPAPVRDVARGGGVSGAGHRGQPRRELLFLRRPRGSIESLAPFLADRGSAMRDRCRDEGVRDHVGRRRWLPRAGGGDGAVGPRVLADALVVLP